MGPAPRDDVPTGRGFVPLRVGPHAPHRNGSPGQWSAASLAPPRPFCRFFVCTQPRPPLTRTEASERFEHWDGTSWSIVPAASFPGVLYAVVALGPRDVWAVG